MVQGDTPAEKAPVPCAGAMVVVLTAVVGLSLYAEGFQNRNNNNQLGAEYWNIASALVSGRGFADPFQEQTGPTAWMAPVLCWVLAGLHWLAADDKEALVALFVLLQDLALIGTGFLA